MSTELRFSAFTEFKGYTESEITALYQHVIAAQSDLFISPNIELVVSVHNRHCEPVLRTSLAKRLCDASDYDAVIFDFALPGPASDAHAALGVLWPDEAIFTFCDAGNTRTPAGLSKTVRSFGLSLQVLRFTQQFNDDYCAVWAIDNLRRLLNHQGPYRPANAAAAHRHARNCLTEQTGWLRTQTSLAA